MLAVVITGPPGSGKSSVLTALADALSDDDIRHAAIEAERLVWAHPALSDEQWRAQLAAVVRLYRQDGYELLLLAQEGIGFDLAKIVAHSRQLAQRMRALGGVDLVLDTDAVTVEETAARIRAAGPFEPRVVRD